MNKMPIKHNLLINNIFPMEYEFNTDSQSVELRAVDRAWRMTKARRSE